MKACAIIVWDRKATAREGRLVTRACGSPTNQVLTVAGDTLFAVCGRHETRLRRAFGKTYQVRG